MNNEQKYDHQHQWTVRDITKIGSNEPIIITWVCDCGAQKTTGEAPQHGY